MRRSSMIQKGIKGSYFQVKTQKMICVLREDLQTDRLTDSLRDNNMYPVSRVAFATNLSRMDTMCAFRLCVYFKVYKYSLHRHIFYFSFI